MTVIPEMDLKVFKAKPVPYGGIFETSLPHMLPSAVSQAGHTHIHTHRQAHTSIRVICDPTQMEIDTVNLSAHTFLYT